VSAVGEYLIALLLALTLVASALRSLRRHSEYESALWNGGYFRHGRKLGRQEVGVDPLHKIANDQRRLAAGSPGLLLPSMRSRAASCQNDPYPTSPFVEVASGRAKTLASGADAPGPLVFSDMGRSSRTRSKPDTRAPRPCGAVKSDN
jgi:hypothetical protein